MAKVIENKDSPACIITKGAYRDRVIREQEEDVEGFQVIYGREQGAQRTFSNDHGEMSNMQVSLHEPTCDPF